MTQKELFDLVLRLGNNLRSPMAASSRTKLMAWAARQFGLRECSVFTIANGIFVSAVVEGELDPVRSGMFPLRPSIWPGWRP